MDDRALTLVSQDPDDTAGWAVALSQIARPGLVICLWGEVGAGKTFFARHLIQTLQAGHGPVEDVPSPTFTLVQIYDAGALEIWHADLYRLGSTNEIYELGLIAAFDTALCLIEWPDRVGDLIPSAALHMTFSHADEDNKRRCKITCDDAATLLDCARLLDINAHV